MSKQRKRDWRERDFLSDMNERGHEPNIQADLDTQPTLPDSEEKDPLFTRGFYVGEFSENSLSKLKSSAGKGVQYEQWIDYQRARNEPDYEQVLEGVPQASYAMQDAYDKVLQMTPLDFPVVMMDVDHADDFMAYANQFYKQPEEEAMAGFVPDEYKRDYVWTTYGLMKMWLFIKDLERNRTIGGHFDPQTARPSTDEEGHSTEPQNNHWRDRLVDNTKETYPDETPCLVLFTRKALYFGSVTFIDDRAEAFTGPLGQVLTAIDAADFDPRINDMLVAGALRETDGGLNTVIPVTGLKAILDEVYIEQPPEGGEPGAGRGDPQGPFDCDDCGGGGGTSDPPPIDPGDPPPGTKPPPGDGGSYPPPAEGTGDRAIFNCETDIIFENTGTNQTYSFADFSLNQNGGWLLTLGLQALIPVNAADIVADVLESIKDKIEDWRVANSKPADYTINRVVLCVSYQRMRRVALLIDGQESFATIDFDRFVGTPLSGFTDPKPRFRLQRGSDGFDKPVRGTIERVGEYEFLAEPFSVEAVADAEICSDKKVPINDFSTLTGLVFYVVAVPAAWDFFTFQSDMPIVKIGLESADLTYHVSKFTGHFDFANDGTLTENPNVSGQFVWFSDDPSGLVSGMIADYVHDGDYLGSEIASGQGPCVLIDADNTDGRAGTPTAVNLLTVADGYSNHPDANYTTVTIHARIIGGAGTAHLNINTAGGGPGNDFYTTFGDTGSFASPPYTAGLVDLVFDISSLGLTTASNIYYVGLDAHIYLFEWTITFS